MQIASNIQNGGKITEFSLATIFRFVKAHKTVKIFAYWTFSVSQTYVDEKYSSFWALLNHGEEILSNRRPAFWGAKSHIFPCYSIFFRTNAILVWYSETKFLDNVMTKNSESERLVF